MKISSTRFATALVGVAGALSFGTAQAVVVSDYDLTGGISHTTGVCATVNGVLVCNAQSSAGSTGSGTFPAFVQGNTQSTSYFMYNTQGAIEPGNAVGNGNPQNQDALLSDFAVTTKNINGTDTSVFTFVLDINEPNSNETVGLLSVNQISIFLGTTGALTGFVGGNPDMLGGTAATWSMDTAAVDSNILLSGFTAGQGKGDMFLYVPVSFLGAAAVTTHLQLYTLFGIPSINDSGFEEWSYLSCSQAAGATCYTPPACRTNCDITVPEPGTLALFGLGLLGVGLGRRKLAA